MRRVQVALTRPKIRRRIGLPIHSFVFSREFACGLPIWPDVAWLSLHSEILHRRVLCVCLCVYVCVRIRPPSGCLLLHPPCLIGVVAVMTDWRPWLVDWIINQVKKNGWRLFR